jgi:RNA polymerase sigma-70 factor (ECF subfamily)
VTNPQNLHPSSSTPDGAGPDYAALVRAAADGSRDAMEQLLMRAQEVAFRFSLLVCGHAEDAEDVMQEALLKTYQYVDRIRDPQAFRTWLYRTVRNACLMKRRLRAGEPQRFVSIEQGDTTNDGERIDVDVEDTAKGPDDLALNEWVGERLRKALQALPPSFRVVVVLREMEGLSTREVADITGISEANVKTRLHRARVLLRAQLEGV